MKKYVTYEEFGAVGDGVHDDFAAICKAHDYANENGLPVKANDNATYYISLVKLFKYICTCFFTHTTTSIFNLHIYIVLISIGTK